jgi:hypothetical protein
VTEFDGFGRLAAGMMQTHPNVLSARTGRGYGFAIRLVVVGDNFLRQALSTFDGLAKNASALSLSRWSRSNKSTTTPFSSTARYKYGFSPYGTGNLVDEPTPAHLSAASDSSG